jgi:acetoin utilization deacetylase AcuC-like enzyme
MNTLDSNQTTPKFLKQIGLQLQVLTFLLIGCVDASSLKTGYAFDEKMLLYGMADGYFNEAGRLSAIDNHLSEIKLNDDIFPTSSIDNAMYWIEKVHSRAHIERMLKAPVWGNDQITKSECGETAVAAVLGAVKSVCEGAIDNAFCNIHPAGHHVEDNPLVTDSSSIYCYANTAIAAKFAQEEYGINRILIIDWDVHHGNGTLTYFSGDTNLYYLDLARKFDPLTSTIKKYCVVMAEPGNCYTDASNNFVFCSMDDMFGYQGLTNEKYKMVLNSYSTEIRNNFSPELVIIACGFDAMRNGYDYGDLTAKGFSEITYQAMMMANQFGRVVSILEGGYADRPANHGDPVPMPRTYNALTACVEYHIRTLMTGEVIRQEHPFYSGVTGNRGYSSINKKPNNFSLYKGIMLFGRENASYPSIYNMQGRFLRNEFFMPAHTNSMCSGVYIIDMQYDKKNNQSGSNQILKLILP